MKNIIMCADDAMSALAPRSFNLGAKLRERLTVVEPAPAIE